jgi:hypothetical protein
MFNSKHYFTKLREHDDHVFQADGTSLQVTGIGTVRLDLPFMVLHLRNALLIPKLSSNLVSQSTFLRFGHYIKPQGTDGFAVVDNQDRTVLDGSYASGNLVICKTIPRTFVAVQPPVSSQTLLLHRLAGHPSLEYLRKMFPDQRIKDFDCIKCDLSKKHKDPFPSSFPTAARCLEYVHLDLCGPISPPSKSGHRYFLQVVDGYSHYIWIHFLTSKTKTKKIIKTLFKQIQSKSDERITYLVLNNGTKFKNKDL